MLCRSNNPFNKEELNSILKFGAEELFKENDDEEGEIQVKTILGNNCIDHIFFPNCKFQGLGKMRGKVRFLFIDTDYFTAKLSGGEMKIVLLNRCDVRLFKRSHFVSFVF